MNSRGVIKGLSVGHLLFGAFFAMAGVVFIIMAFFWNYTLRFHGIVLPQWVVYAVAVIAAAFGAYGVRESFRTWKCAACGSALRYGEAFYPAGYEKQIVQSYESLDARLLQGIPPRGKEPEWIRLSLDYCGGCGKVGVLSLTGEYRDREKRVLGKPRVIPGESVPSFLPLLRPTSRIDPLTFDE